MARRRNRLNWTYDNELQQFTTPAGRTISLHDIAQLLQDQAESRHDLAGPWTGWRIRQNRLIPPGELFRNSQITPANLRAFTRWLRSFEGEQAQLEFRTEQVARAESAQATRDAESHIPDTHHDTEAASHLAESPNQETAEPYEPRRRAKVVELAAYRKRPA